MRILIRVGAFAIAISSLVLLSSCDLDSKVVVLSQNSDSTKNSTDLLKKDNLSEIENNGNFVL